MDHVSKKFGDFAISDICLSINDGEYLIILGTSGSGKTMLLEMIAGIQYPDSGKIIMNGEDITNLPPARRNIRMVYQDYLLFPHRTVEDNISFEFSSRKNAEKSAASRLNELANLLDISYLLQRYPKTLSGGEKQRVAIARALMVKPDILLLDEPLSSLDSRTKVRLRSELQKINTTTRTTVVHVTHSFDELFLSSHRIAIINNGQLIQIGEPDTILRNPKTKFVSTFPEMSNLFKGAASYEDDESFITINGIRIISSTRRKGSVYFSIRPEDIIVSTKPVKSSARNSFEGIIKSTDIKEPIIRITADIGIPIIASITKRSFNDLKLAVGEKVYLTFKATAVNVFNKRTSSLS